ncbi:hypothetical protein O6P43_013755 [Quillaja saponaria]|uniref:Uncharacterized protein n=1 Tax=Quillaja saponaria TaxID=32244 RepID=A0AAD7LTA0_QUISA|nr:hypothetical protein O6P43_013755 [Quillaja saponaria]
MSLSSGIKARPGSKMVNVNANAIDLRLTALESRMENMDSRIDSSIQELKVDSEAKFQAMMEAMNSRFQEILAALTSLQRPRENHHPPPPDLNQHHHPATPNLIEPPIFSNPLGIHLVPPIMADFPAGPHPLPKPEDRDSGSSTYKRDSLARTKTRAARNHQLEN